MFRKKRGFIPHLKKDTGFTLIELLIVIAVIGILAAAIMPRFISFDTDAKIATNKGSLSSLKAALVLYRAKLGEYPGRISTLVDTYIEKIPEVQGTAAGTDADATATGLTVSGITGGWIYLSDTNQIFLNYTGTDDDGTYYTDY